MNQQIATTATSAPRPANRRARKLGPWAREAVGASGLSSAAVSGMEEASSSGMSIYRSLVSAAQGADELDIEGEGARLEVDDGAPAGEHGVLREQHALVVGETAFVAQACDPI